MKLLVSFIEKYIFGSKIWLIIAKLVDF